MQPQRPFVTVLGCLAFSILLAGSCRAWRSALYPEDGAPGRKDAEGRFLHDFSYAGYHAGEPPLPDNPPGKRIDVTKPPYDADPTGNADATDAIQKALDDAGAAGGGIVSLPAGTYSVRPQGNNDWALRISRSGVVLRGSGEPTRILLHETNMRQKCVILVAPPKTYAWKYPLAQGGIKSLAIAHDLLEPTATIPLVSAPPYQVGDWVIIRGDATEDFIAEHHMQGLWPATMWPQLYYRRVVAVDRENHTLTVDAPTRYPLKTRDNARVYKVRPHIEEVGVEHLAIGMRENLKARVETPGGEKGENFVWGLAEKSLVPPGLGENDYTWPGTAGYEAHNSEAISFNDVVNGWIQGVTTYRPPENRNDWHILSNGISLVESRFITVRDCRLKNPEYRGGGGNGYLFHLVSNDCLVTNCTAENGRHNFSFATSAANGNVIHRCVAIGGLLPSEFHRQLSLANLIDNLTLVREVFHAGLRPPNTTHGHSSTQCVLWSVMGKEAAPGASYVVSSTQYGWGYVIGTSGAVTKVDLGAALRENERKKCDPADYVEGEGKGATLVPQSLYEDQLSRRLRSARER